MTARWRSRLTGSVNFYIKYLIFSPGFNYLPVLGFGLGGYVLMYFKASCGEAASYQPLTSFWSLPTYQDGNPRRGAANCKNSKCAGT